jgi:hypothetical protein
MPEEKAPATPASPSFRAQAESIILDPYRLLVIGAYMIAIGGLILAIVDVAAWAGNATEAFEFFSLDIAKTVASFSIVVGIIAVIHGVRQRKGASPDGAATDLKQAMTNPVWLLNIAPDAVLATGAANLLFFLIDSYDIGVIDIFTAIFDILFRTSMAFFLVMTLKYVSDWLHGTERPVPQAGEPGSTPAWKLRYWRLVRSPDMFLLFGMLLTLYFAMLELIFEIWDRWEDPSGILWLEFFEHMAEAGGVVAVLLVARAIVNWLRGTPVPAGGFSRAPQEHWMAWAYRVAANPRLVIDVALLFALLGGVPFYIMDVWDFRNEPVTTFWSLVLEDTLFGVSIIGSLLVLRAFATHLVNGSAGTYGERLAGTGDGAFYNDPAKMLRALVYLIPFIGLTYISVIVWDWRGEGFWIVWYFFFLIGGYMLVPLAIFIGGRALYAEAWAEQPVMLASTDGKVSQPAAASLTPPGSTGTLA